MSVVLRRPTPLGLAPLLCDDAAGWSVSPSGLLENRVVYVRLRQQPFEAAVLPLQLFEAFRLIDSETAVASLKRCTICSELRRLFAIPVLPILPGLT